MKWTQEKCGFSYDDNWGINIEKVDKWEALVSILGEKNKEIKNKLKGEKVRRKLLQDQLTLAEALKYARGLESVDQHATKVENQTPTDVTVKQEVDKITVDRTGKKSCFNCGKQWPHQGGKRKCPAFGKQCTRCGKRRNHFANYCRSKQEIKVTKEFAYGGEEKSNTSSESSDESTCTLEKVNVTILLLRDTVTASWRTYLRASFWIKCFSLNRHLESGFVSFSLIPEQELSV